MTSEELKNHLKTLHNIKYKNWYYAVYNKKLMKSEEWNCRNCKTKFVFSVGDESILHSIFNEKEKWKFNVDSNVRDEYASLSCEEFDVKEIIE